MKIKLISTLIGCIIHGLVFSQGIVRGKVSDVSGELPGISVVMRGPTSTTLFTDIDGTYTVEVTPGRYRITVKTLGYRPQQYSTYIRDGEVVTIDFLLEFAIGGVTKGVTLIEQSALDAPATVHVVNRKQILERGYTNIQELLEDIPEIEIQRKSTTEFKDLIGFRGIAGNEKFLIMMDGVRVTAATGDPHTIHTNYSLMNAERVEVILGPASAVYGVDAFSGVVNIITRKGGQFKGIEATLSYGSFTTANYALSIGQNKEDFSFAITGNLYSSKEPDFPVYYPEAFDWHTSRYEPYGTVRADIFSDDTMSLSEIENRTFAAESSSYFVNARVNFKDFEIGYFKNGELHSSSTAVRPEFSLYQDDTQFGYNLETIYGRHTYKSETQKWQIQSLLTQNSMELNTKSLFKNIYTNYQSGYKYQFGKTQKIEEQVTYKPSNEFSLLFGFSFEDIVALPKTGDLPFAFDKTISAENQEQHYLGTDIQDAQGNSLRLLQDFFFLQYQNLGGFAQVQFKPTKAIEATLGLRYDNNTRYGSSMNPRIGVVLKPTTSFRMKLVYGEAFLSPSPWKAYQHFGSFAPRVDNSGNISGLFAPFFHLPNPDLKPEKLRSLETGISWIVSDDFMVTLNLYYNRLNNLINFYTQDTVRDSFKGIPIQYAQTASNQGAARTFGGTFGFNGKSMLGENEWSYYCYYSIVEGDRNEEQLPFAARHTVKAGMTLSFGNFSITPQYIYRTSTFSLVQDGEGNYISNDPYGLFNVASRVQLSQNKRFNLSLFLKATNVFNTSYYNVSFIGTEGFIQTPQDPMRINVGFQVGFL